MEKIWLEHYKAGVPKDIQLDGSTLASWFEETCKKYASKRAITCHGETITFKQVYEYVNNLAASLVDLDVTKGDRVAVIMPNIMQYPLAVFAILKIGAVVVNVNPLYTEYEMEYILENSQAKVAIVLDFMAGKLNGLKGKNSLEHIIVTRITDPYPFFKRHLINFAVRFIKRINTSYNYAAHDFYKLITTSNLLSYNPNLIDEDLAFIQYTGATTGRPKGAILSHRNIVANVLQIHAWISSDLDVSKQIVIDALPLYHIFSLTANLFTFFFSGSESVMIPNPRDLSDTLKVLKNTPFTVFNALETLYSHLLNSKEFVTSKFPSFQYSVAGGMPCRASIANKWYEVTGVMPTNCYGLTETSPAATMSKVSKSFNGSVGFPISSTEVEVRDIQTKLPLPIGETGVIYIRGPQVSRGYWKNVEQTAAAFSDDGWFNTKDIGHFNEFGQLFISGRESEMIIVSGFNVYPAEVEYALDQIPEIKSSAIVGTPDTNTGEAVVAFLILEDGMEISDKEIMAKCREKLASYKVPRRIFILNELPKTLVGKVDKIALAKQYLKNV